MYGLVLEGGGAKGAYQIGAWTAIRELEIQLAGAVGTSVGALNAAMIMQDDYDAAKDLWENMTFTSVFKMNDGILEKIINYRFESKDVSQYREELRRVLKIEGLDITPFKKTIRKYLKEYRLRNMHRDFGLVTVFLTDMKRLELFLEDIPKGHLAGMLLASCYLPVFKLEKVYGKIYLDGGFYNNLPTRMLTRKGYKNIIEIRLHDNDMIQFPVENEEINIIRIQPKENLGSSLDFDNKRIMYNMELGYYDTLKVFKNLKGNKYYIEFSYKEHEIISVLVQNSNKLEPIANILDIDQEITNEVILELIIPTIKKNLNMNNITDYTEFIVGMIEYIGDKLHINRFKVYRFDEFLDSIVLQKENLNMNDFSIIDKLRNNHLLIKELIEIIEGGLQFEEI